MLPLLAADERSEDHHPVSWTQRKQLCCNRFRRLRRKNSPAVRTVRHSDVRIEKPEIVIDLRHRCNGRTRRSSGRALFNRNRRGKSFDVFDFRLLHAIEELPCISGETLNIAPLPLGVKRIERE